MKDKPALLYISPVTPALTGNGLAMRAGTVLEALAAHYSISLLVIPQYAGEQLPQRLRDLCRGVAMVAPSPANPLVRLLPQGFQRPAYRWNQFQVVHVFRLAALPWARPFLGGAARLHLDLDDVESVARRRVAALHRGAGDEKSARLEDALARRAETEEKEALERANRVYVCSTLDRARLIGQARSEVRVLPNAVRIPPAPPMSDPGGPFRILLIGSLGYYPNQDAVRYFCAEILPIVRERARGPVECEVVGAGAPEELQRMMAAAGVHYAGRAPEVDVCYHRASIAVAPLRAGGGTRIKILEAFSFRRPVVSTSLGAEGIEARDGEDLLIADSAPDFAVACLRLMEDRALYERLAENAFELVNRHHSPTALREATSP